MCAPSAHTERETLSRLPYVEDASDVVTEMRQRRNGDLRPLDKVLLNSPAVARGWNTYLRSIREETELDPGFRELLILRVATLTACDYEWDAHVKVARKVGVPEEAIDLVGMAKVAESGSSELDLLIDVVDSITTETRVSDSDFLRLEAQFTGKQILEIVATVATYNMVSRVLNTLHIGEEEAAHASGE